MKKLTAIQLHLTKADLIKAIRDRWPIEVDEIDKQGSLTLEISPLPDAFLVLQARPTSQEGVAQNEPN